MILDFLPKSKSEKNIRAVLPASSWNAQWWQEGVIARNIGRGLFRIHGTGQPAPVNEPYYPFFGTSGCVAQRENFYDGVEYKDQRLLLDRLMHSLGMHSVYENEESIQGLLFVMNINSEDRAVELSDLHRLKILPQ